MRAIFQDNAKATMLPSTRNIRQFSWTRYISFESFEKSSAEAETHTHTASPSTTVTYYFRRHEPHCLVFGEFRLRIIPVAIAGILFYSKNKLLFINNRSVLGDRADTLSNGLFRSFDKLTQRWEKSSIHYKTHKAWQTQSQHFLKDVCYAKSELARKTPK